MTIEWAREELIRRREEQAAAEADGTWETFAQMKRAWAFRRKDIGYSRAKARAWLEIAEQEMN